MPAPIAIFFRPAAVFRGLRKRPRWIAPFCLTVLLTFVSAFALIRIVGMELITLQRFQHNVGLSGRAASESIDAAVNAANSRGPKLILLARDGGLIAAASLCLAFIFRAVASLMDTGLEVSYWQMLAMVCYAFYPIALIRCVWTISILLLSQDHAGMDLENVIGLNLGELVDRFTANPSVFAIASAMDLVNFAQVLFLAFGFAKTAGIPFLRSLAFCGILWIVLILWQAALATIL